ncbi:MAG: imidazole glycerol phosphate synthase subunit HisH [Candidatus Puniceispirillaceae bacterium]
MSIIAVIDYGSGNLRSVVNAVRAAATDDGRDDKVILAKTGEDLVSADAIILPGVGHFADCRRNLANATGLEQSLSEMVHAKARPFLGICVGMQMMATTGYEGQAIDGLSWIAGDVKRLQPDPSSLKIPHMGWNALTFSRPHPVTSHMSSCAQVYFVHSYHMRANDAQAVVATTDYGHPVTAIIARDTMIGTQFHPEKSQAEGQSFLRGFLNWRP